MELIQTGFRSIIFTMKIAIIQLSDIHIRHVA